MINYEVAVVTGNVLTGGTDANVFCQMYGDEGKTEVLQLVTRSDNYERGTTEIIRVCMKPYVRDLTPWPPFDLLFYTCNPDRGS